jgi:hypothetical protein
VHVKNAPDQILGRMPFFITSNHDVWKYGNALRERIITYRFFTQINNDPQTALQEGSPLLHTVRSVSSPAKQGNSINRKGSPYKTLQNHGCL